MFNEETTKESVDRKKSAHSSCKECVFKNKVLAGLIKDVNRQKDKFMLYKDYYKILLSLYCQEYDKRETEGRMILENRKAQESLNHQCNVILQGLTQEEIDYAQHKNALNYVNIYKRCIDLCN